MTRSKKILQMMDMLKVQTPSLYNTHLVCCGSTSWVGVSLLIVWFLLKNKQIFPCCISRIQWTDSVIYNNNQCFNSFKMAGYSAFKSQRDAEKDHKCVCDFVKCPPMQMCCEGLGMMSTSHNLIFFDKFILPQRSSA